MYAAFSLVKLAAASSYRPFQVVARVLLARTKATDVRIRQYLKTMLFRTAKVRPSLGASAAVKIPSPLEGTAALLQ